MLHTCFVKQMVPKYDDLADFSSPSLPNMHAYMCIIVMLAWFLEITYFCVVSRYVFVLCVCVYAPEAINN